MEVRNSMYCVIFSVFRDKIAMESAVTSCQSTGRNAGVQRWFLRCFDETADAQKIKLMPLKLDFGWL